MLKTLFVIFSAVLFLLSVPAQNVSSQISKENQPVQTNDESGFYSKDFLKSDYKQVDVVLYVDVKSRELADQIGAGGCEKDAGAGYCLYLLKAEVKEVFKGKISRRNFEFYTVIDADYKNKDQLLGEQIVFLKWSDNYPNKRNSLGTLENSTRSIKFDVVETMRRISREKSSKKN